MSNGKDKAFTNHPLMDEICFNCKRILKGIVVKNDVLANAKETDKSIENAEMYSVYKKYGTIPLEMFYLTEPLLQEFGYNRFQIRAILNDKRAIPESEKEELQAFANQYFLDNYFEPDGRFKEENDYYRMFTGLPPYESGEEFFIYLKKSDIPTTFKKPIDFSIPLHLQDRLLINILYSNGTIDRIRKENPGSNYSYIMYLGDRSIDLFKARQASKWDILYIPNVENLVKDKFTEFYRINRDMYMNRSYQEFFADTGEYYDQMMIVIVLAQTFNDLIVDTPQWYIRRDIFDLRSCQYFLESNGVEFFKIIPLKYQIRIVKNLNRLISYKSSNKNVQDILDVFDVDNTRIFKYWLYKKKLYEKKPSYIIPPYEPDEPEEPEQPPIIEEPEDEHFNAPEVLRWDFGCLDEADTLLLEDQYWDFSSLDNGTAEDSNIIDEGDYDFNLLAVYTDKEVIPPKNLDPEVPPEEQPPEIPDDERDNIVDVVDKAVDEFELEFIASEINDSYDNYIKEHRYITPYDDITMQDKYWDGDQDHSDVRDIILAKDFTIVGTKYMSIEYEVELEKFQYQMAYLLGLIVNSKIDSSDITISVPTVDEFAQFTISDLFLFLIALTNNYSIVDGYSATKTRVFDLWQGAPPEIDEEVYDWKTKYFSEFFIKEDGRVEGFNPDVDIEALLEVLERRHSHYRFGAGDNVYEDIPLVGEEYKERAREWIRELGVYDYIVPNYKITSLDQLVELYQNNTKCYETLKKALEEVVDQDEKAYLEYIFKELFTRKFDIDYYTNPETGVKYDNLVDIMRDHNYILYTVYQRIMQETNIESRQDTIRAVMNDVIITLEYYLSGKGMEFLYSFTSNESFSSIIYYIYLITNFFKSYKVYFLDPYVTFLSSDKKENSAKAIDRIAETKFIYDKWDKCFTADYITGISVQLIYRDRQVADMVHEEVDIYSHFEDVDMFMDYDYDGYTETEDVERVNVDAGDHDETKIAPFRTIDGGKAFESNVDIHDINGGEPAVYDREYYDIDGGPAYNKDEYKTDMFGSQMFNYVIDGGSADSKRFMNNLIDLQIAGAEIFANIIISPRTQYIEIKPDGLYVNPDHFGSRVQFNNLINTVNYLIDTIMVKGSQVSEDLKVMTNEALFQARVDRLVDGYTANIDYVVDNIYLSDNYQNELNRYVDDCCIALRDDLANYMNPFSWENL